MSIPYSVGPVDSRAPEHREPSPAESPRRPRGPLCFCKENVMVPASLILRGLYLNPVLRKLFALWLCFLVMLALPFHNLTAQTCSISPSQPQAAGPGQCVQFNAGGCGSVSWTLTGTGTLDQSGQYCAPATIYPQNYSRGVQQLPNSSAYNTSVYNWPVHPNSALWVSRIASDAPTQGSYHNFKLGAPPRFFQNLFNNSIDDTTPKQMVHAVLPWCPDCQDTELPMLQPPFVEMQAGWSMDVYGASSGGTGPDRHLLQADRSAQLQYEYYQVMTDSHNVVFTPGSPTQVQFDTNVLRKLQNPLRMQVNGATGACAGMNFNGYAASSFLITIVSQTAATNGYQWHVSATIPYNSQSCSSGDLGSAWLAASSSNVAAANVGSMAVWSSADNSVYGGPDAGGSSIVATSGDPVQWWNSVMNGYADPNCGGCNTAFQHALRTTLGNQMISARVIPPASLYAAGGHPRMQLTSCTPTNPIQCTSSYNLGTSGLDACEAPTPWLTVTPGCSFHIAFTGLTGNWALLNDNVDHTNTFYATAVTDSYHFTIPVDGRTLGTGTWNGNQYTMFDWAPYGTRFRLKSSFNVAGYCSGDLTTACPFEKALLNTLKVYGMVLLDGTAPADNWDTGILSNGFYPDQLVDAAEALHNWSPVESSLEVVDPANTQPLWTPTAYLTAGNQEGTTNGNRVTVCANHSACMDVYLQGTVVGIDPERMPLIPAGGSYQAKVWVNNNPDTSHSCSLSPSVAGASVTEDGLITAPARGALSAPAITTMVCTSTAAPQAKSYATVEFMPWSPDGSLRLCLGCLKTTVTDHLGQVWYGQVTQRAVTDSYQPGGGLAVRAAIRLVEFLSDELGQLHRRVALRRQPLAPQRCRAARRAAERTVHGQREGRVRLGRGGDGRERLRRRDQRQSGCGMAGWLRVGRRTVERLYAELFGDREQWGAELCSARSPGHHREPIWHEPVGGADRSCGQQSAAVCAAGAVGQRHGRNSVSVPIQRYRRRNTIQLCDDAGLVASGNATGIDRTFRGHTDLGWDVQLHRRGLRQLDAAAAVSDRFDNGGHQQSAGAAAADPDGLVAQRHERCRLRRDASRLGRRATVQVVELFGATPGVAVDLRG